VAVQQGREAKTHLKTKIKLSVPQKGDYDEISEGVIPVPDFDDFVMHRKQKDDSSRYVVYLYFICIVLL